ncbi:MAG: hypothetical protein V1726_01240 [Methanobacteriota archaeon]
MKQSVSRRLFISDDRAVSEEFTTLPGLTIVIIGFALFVVLIAQTYTAYQLRVESLQKYQTAGFLTMKLTNPECSFIQEGGVVNLQVMNTESCKEQLNTTRQSYRISGVDFIVRITADTFSQDFPIELPEDIGDHIAVTKNVGIYLNEAQTVPGSFTIITWNCLKETSTGSLLLSDGLDGEVVGVGMMLMFCTIIATVLSIGFGRKKELGGKHL